MGKNTISYDYTYTDSTGVADNLQSALVGSKFLLGAGDDMLRGYIPSSADYDKPFFVDGGDGHDRFFLAVAAEDAGTPIEVNLANKFIKITTGSGTTKSKIKNIEHFLYEGQVYAPTDPMELLVTGTDSGERVSLYSVDARVNLGGGNDEIDLVGGNHIVRGGGGNDEFVLRSTGTSKFKGDGGKDEFYVQGVFDQATINGGKGADWLVIEYHGNSYDSITINLAAGTMTFNLGLGSGESDMLAGISGIENVATHLSRALNVYGNDANNKLIGYSQNDRLFGGKGNDRIEGRNGNDIIDGGQGNDRILAGDGADRVIGGKGKDYIDLGFDSDVDQFRFTKNHLAKSIKDTDTIINFDVDDDIIDTTGVDADRTTKGVWDDFTFNGTQAAANAIWIKEKGGDTRVFFDIDGDAKADKSLLLQDTLGVTEDNFLMAGSVLM